MPAGSIAVTDDGAGTLTVTFTGTVSNEEFRAYLDDMTTRLARGLPYAVILDARHSDRTPAIQRKMQADWIAHHKDRLRRHCLGNAFVISSPLVRGVLTAILWLEPLPVPYVVVETFEDADAWVRERLPRRA